jgi:hypothetical protein
LLWFEIFMQRIHTEGTGCFAVVPTVLVGEACVVGFLTALVAVVGLPFAPPATLERFVTPAIELVSPFP